jgi:anti-sigma regulatory factor (Ser/Thr protein kinase)
MPGRFELSVDADLESLGEIRSFIRQAGAALGVRDDALGDLCLVVDEAVTNVILHGYQGARGPVDIHVQREGDAVVIVLRDQARTFDGRGVEAPHLDESLAERKSGGMGVYLIRKLTDEAEYRPRAGRGNELRLVKRRAIGAA